MSDMDQSHSAGQMALKAQGYLAIPSSPVFRSQRSADFGSRWQR